MGDRKKAAFRSAAKQLEVYAKFSGWAHSKAEGQSATRGELWQLGQPDAGALDYIWGWLVEIGLGSPLSWPDVKAWSDMTGIQAGPDDAALLVRISNLWCNEYARGTREKDALPAPDVQEVIFSG